MVGGTVIENRAVLCGEAKTWRRQLWCADRRSTDECAVFADMDEAEDVRAGDWIWWQSGTIYWTRYEHPDDEEPVFCEVPLKKIGFSFDPRPKPPQEQTNDPT